MSPSERKKANNGGAQSEKDEDSGKTALNRKCNCDTGNDQSQGAETKEEATKHGEILRVDGPTSK